METKLLIPRQPYQILLSEQYLKKVVLDYGISHFYECCISDGVSEIPTSVPDGCIDVMFYWNKDLSEMGADVIGTPLRPHAIGVHVGCHYFGVRFLPGEPFVFEPLAFSELIERTVPLSDTAENRLLIEKIATAQNFEARIEVFMKMYLPKYITVCGNAAVESMNRQMIKGILEKKGNVKIGDLAWDMGYSERYASRVFAENNGITPKKFCRIIRFQNALQEIEEQGSKSYCFRDFEEIGYYDEAHLIHDFKEFCGQSPVKFINEIIREKTERLKIL
ncbi:MAG: helix-turn-helix domain-containing protein [Roseburia sp.]|nr:helix-turn-helix domain-containing protein [Roseburia sp.]